MAIATRVNLEVFRGEDKALAWSMLPPTNITGWGLKFSVRRRFNTAVLFSKTIGSGITVTNAALGEATILVSAADTANLEWGKYRFDVLRTDNANSDVLTIGQFILLPRVGT